MSHGSSWRTSFCISCLQSGEHGQHEQRFQHVLRGGITLCPWWKRGRIILIKQKIVNNLIQRGRRTSSKTQREESKTTKIITLIFAWSLVMMFCLILVLPSIAKGEIVGNMLSLMEKAQQRQRSSSKEQWRSNNKRYYQGKEAEEDICCYSYKVARNKHKDQQTKDKQHKSNKQWRNTKELWYAWIMLQRLLYWRICCDVKLLIELNSCDARARLQGKGKDVANIVVMH